MTRARGDERERITVIGTWRELYARGWTLQRIGEHFGVSRQRVQQALGAEPGRHWDPACAVPGCTVAVAAADICERHGSRWRQDRRLTLRPLLGCGTPAAYARGCRCIPCRKANSQYRAPQRVTRQQHPIPLTVIHGSASTYTNWGCRCSACTIAHAERIRVLRRVRRERAVA